MGRFDEIAGLTEAKQAPTLFDRLTGLAEDTPLEDQPVELVGDFLERSRAALTAGAVTEGKGKNYGKIMSAVYDHATAAQKAVSALEDEISTDQTRLTKKLGQKARSECAAIQQLAAGKHEDEEQDGAAVAESEIAASRAEHAAKLREALGEEAYKKLAAAGLTNGLAEAISMSRAGLPQPGDVVERVDDAEISEGKAGVVDVHFASGKWMPVHIHRVAGTEDTGLTEAKKGSLRALKHKVWMSPPKGSTAEAELMAAFKAKGDAHLFADSKKTSPFVKEGGAFVVEDESALAENTSRFDQLAGIRLTECATLTPATDTEPVTYTIDLTGLTTEVALAKLEEAKAALTESCGKHDGDEEKPEGEEKDEPEEKPEAEPEDEKKTEDDEKHPRGALVPPGSKVPAVAVDAGPDVRPEDYAEGDEPADCIEDWERAAQVIDDGT